MAEIELTQGYKAIIDDEDLTKVDIFKWHVSRTKNNLSYARRTIVFPRKDGKQQQAKQYLHRYILGIDDPKIKIDFRDDDPLNCQRANLIISNHQGVSLNTIPRKRKLSKGVRKKGKKWHSRIKINGINEFIGSYLTEKEASVDYQEKSLAALNNVIK